MLRLVVGAGRSRGYCVLRHATLEVCLVEAEAEKAYYLHTGPLNTTTVCVKTVRWVQTPQKRVFTWHTTALNEAGASS